MNEFMELAYQEALKGISMKHGGPFGAVIVKNETVISQGHNEVLLRNDPTAHAEIVAIRRACEFLRTVDLHECVLYTTSKPCPMCKGAIQWSRLQKVVYSGDYEDVKKLNFDDLDFSNTFNQEDIAWTKIDHEHFIKLINAFQEYKDDIRY